MNLSCPICKKYEFTYGEILHMSPGGHEFSPNRLDCGGCNARLRITRKSRLLFIAIFFVSLIGNIFGMNAIFPKASKVLLLISMVSVITCVYFIIWPRIVESEYWAPYKYWLPKSRLLGYTVYLVLPISVIIGLFCIVIFFR